MDPGLQHPAADRLAHLLNALAVLALFLYAVLTFEDLPEKIPVHFTTGGQPDGWADKSWGAWLALPLVALGLTALFYAISRLVGLARRHPRWLNLPHKKEFLALPEERQAPVWRKMKSLLYQMAVPANLTILYAFHTTRATATSDSPTLVMWPFWLCLGLLLAVAFAATFSLVRAVRKAVEEQRQESAGR